MSTPSLNRERKTTATMPSFDHPPWRQLLRMWDPLEAPLNVYACCSCGALGALSPSLSVEAGRSTFDIMVGLPLHAWGALRFFF